MSEQNCERCASVDELCCEQMTELSKLRQETARLRERVAELEAIAKRWLRMRSNIECMGEWSALEINRSLYKKEEAKVDALSKETLALLSTPNQEFGK
jgi:hypothetical protein